METAVEKEITEGDAFEEMEIDALKEAGNIGASHASTAMSSLIRTTVTISVPDCIVCRSEKLPSSVGEADDPVVATFFQVYGKGQGNLIMIMPIETASTLADLMLGKEHVPGSPLDEDGGSAIAEMGNICTSAYLNAMAQFLGTTMLPSPPAVAMDSLHAILQLPAQLVAEQAEYVVVLKTSFVIENEIYKGCFIFLPDPESQKMLLSKFKLDEMRQGQA